MMLLMMIRTAAAKRSLLSPPQAAGLSHLTELRRTLMRSWPRTISHQLVPANAGTHNPWPQKVKKGLCSSVEARVRAAAMSACAHAGVPAFAGTTRWKILYAIALPQAGRGESDLGADSTQRHQALACDCGHHLSRPHVRRPLARGASGQPAPTISALPPVPPAREAPLASERLYHEFSHAAADMARIPQMPTRKC